MSLLIGDIVGAYARILETGARLVITAIRLAYNFMRTVLFTRVYWILRIIWRRVEILLRHLSSLSRGILSFGVRSPEGMFAVMVFVRDLLMPS